MDELYRSTRVVRLRTRAQMVLLVTEQRLTAAAIATIVRERRDGAPLAQALPGQRCRRVARPAPRGRPATVTDAYREQLLYTDRRRPRSLRQPYSLWTLQRLADYLAEQTGIRVGYDTVRLHPKAAGLVLNRAQHTISSPDPEHVVEKGRLRTRDVLAAGDHFY